ncbi:acyl-CoA synthetase [Mycolicibacterium komossense]|uniref:Acyl-CoA synthetase n=1 Tax=Mycolicibacterium komossense TaxID=1779 RepID=A0ABT3CJK1_9MYCO|nr:acyl-CoA synthetase [Mycolicibacterium komossense]MCV7229488.1 acyl-CoA synthetase [Mycolicibacterium komossense]
MTDVDALWPRYRGPDDLSAIEALPLSDRGLPSTTYALLTRAAELWPDQPALSVLPDGQRWQHPAVHTFSDLLADVHRTANLLRSLGVGRTSAVALISPNCDELITATLAAQLVGIAAPINGALSAGHVAELVGRSGARVLISGSPDLDPAGWTIAQHLVAIGAVDTVLILQATGTVAAAPAPELAGAAVHNLTELARTYDGTAFTGEPPAATDLAALFHTGGTTGTPKLAAHTHRNEVTDAWMIASNTELGSDSVVFAALPLFHVNALVVTTLAPLLRGQHVVWAGPLGYRDPGLYGAFWKIVEHYGVSAMSAVPTVYAVLAQCPIDADISSMRVALVGASALPAAVRKDFESHTGITLVEGYGLTEATCASARSFPDHPRPGSVGQRMPYQQIKTVRIDDTGRWHDLPRHTVGNLAISGPTVFPGYVTERTTDRFVLDGLGVLVDGWLDTGDLAWIDDDGFVHLTGRAKDLIIRGGHNIDPTVIEDALLAHPGVTAAAAVGRPDIHAGEVPVAYVTLRPGAGCTGEELHAWVADKVSERASAPKSVTVVDTLPVTAIGKPYKLPLRADATRNAVVEALSGLSGVEAVDAGTEGGSTVVTVTVNERADREAVESTLSRYPLTYRVQCPR